MIIIQRSRKHIGYLQGVALVVHGYRDLIASHRTKVPTVDDCTELVSVLCNQAKLFAESLLGLDAIWHDTGLKPVVITDTSVRGLMIRPGIS